jgi:hypothetical protein
MFSVTDRLPRLADVKYAESRVSRASWSLTHGGPKARESSPNLRALELDDVGAQVGEILACPGTGEYARKIEDADFR